MKSQPTIAGATPEPPASASLLADPENADFRLQHSPFFWLNRVHGLYLLAIERRLKTVGMDVPRWRVLMVLAEEEPASVSRLADLSVIKLSTMVRIVERMEESGLIITHTSAEDARVKMVAMSAAGREALALVRREGGAVYRDVFGDAGDADIAGLIERLRQVYQQLAGVSGRRADAPPTGGDHPCG